nr:reverse transcriptase domain-containing protein [Tanacetum cinerariifolium]
PDHLQDSSVINLQIQLHLRIRIRKNKQFYGDDKEDPHAHIRYFNKITSTLKFPNVPNTSIKLMLFPFSLEDQDSLNSAVGGNFLDKIPCECLAIIESKSKVRYSLDKPVVAKVSTNASTSGVSPDVAELKDMVKALLLDKKGQNQSPAPVKAVEESCVTCGGTHSYRNCPATNGNVYRDNIQEFVSQAFAVNYNQGNPGYRPPALAQQNQNVHLNELEKVKRMNEANMKAMQTQIDMVKNELRNEMKNSIQTSLSNQTNEIKNMMASLLQMNTASTSGGRVIDGPTVPTPPQSINPEVDERVEELSIPSRSHLLPSKNTSLRLKENMLCIKGIHFIRTSLILQGCSNKNSKRKMKSKSKNFGKSVILKKLSEKLRDIGKFLILCGFSELKCKALADLGASINLMPLSVWKKLSLPKLIPTRMTLELANRAIYTPAGIARDLFVPVGKFTFPVNFVIVDYESDPRVPLILGRPFLRIARALIDVHGEEMILRDGDKRLTLNMGHDTSSYSNQPQKESINLINVFNNSSEIFLRICFQISQVAIPLFCLILRTSPEVNNDIFDSEGCNVLSKKLLDLDSTKDLHPPLHDNPLSGSTTYFSNPLLEEFADELPPTYDDNLQFDIESDLKKIEFLLYQDKDSSLKDSID